MLLEPSNTYNCGMCEFLEICIPYNFWLHKDERLRGCLLIIPDSYERRKIEILVIKLEHDKCDKLHPTPPSKWTKVLNLFNETVL